MSISRLQANGGNGAAITSLGVAYSSNVTAGSLLIACIRDGSSVNNVNASITDSNNAGNWTKAIERDLTVDLDTAAIYYRLNAASGATTVTYHTGQGAGTLRMVIIEYSGIATSSALDQTSSGYNASSTAPNSGATATLAQATELALGYGDQVNAPSGAWTAGGGYTLVSDAFTASGQNQLKLGVSELFTASTAAQTATFTIPTTADEWSCMIATFKGAGAGAPTVHTLMSMGMGN